MLIETSRLLRGKTTLYRFEIGNDVFCFNDSKKNVIFQNEIYYTDVISHDPIEQTQGSSNTDVTIYTHLKNKLIQNYDLKELPVNRYIIRQVYSNNPDEAWDFISKGEIVGIETDMENANIKAVDNCKLLKSTNLNYTFSAFCNHEIYNTETCGLQFNDYAFTTKIVDISIDRMTIKLETFPAFSIDIKAAIFRDNKDNNEMVVDFDSVEKTITLLNPVYLYTKINDTIKIAPNCKGMYTTCNDYFNNIENISACMFVKNSPFDQGGLK